MSKKTFVKNPQKKKGEGELTYEVRYAKADLRTGYQVEAVGNLITSINEARADFPKYPDIANYPQGGKAWFDALDQYDHDVEEWFKKWFEETKQQ